MSAPDHFDAARAWFAAQGFTPFAFQEDVWAAYACGESGLIHALTTEALETRVARMVADLEAAAQRVERRCVAKDDDDERP